jgi:hypothetical protein
MSEEGLLTACADAPPSGSEADLFPIRVRGLKNAFGPHVVHETSISMCGGVRFSAWLAVRALASRR